MKIGFIGLGRMGKNMVLNLIDKGNSVVGYDKNKIELRNIKTVDSIKDLVGTLPKQKIVWLMVPSKAVDKVISDLSKYLVKEDIIIDGGNSYFKDSVRRYERLRKKKINFVDVGTSGGVKGARYGACMMVGGDYRIFKKLEGLFKSMCVKNGYGYMGKAGAGHFVKMVHNGIEYGMMSSIAEGMEAIRKYSQKFGINIKGVAKVYAHGSIIEGRLMNFLLDGMNSAEFKSVKGEVPYGETESEMKKLEKIAKMPILHQARIMRAKTRRKRSFVGKIIAVMRKQFGGHKVKK